MEHNTLPRMGTREEMATYVGVFFGAFAECEFKIRLMITFLFVVAVFYPAWVNRIVQESVLEYIADGENKK